LIYFLFYNKIVKEGMAVSKEKRKEYSAKYREKNKEKIREIQKKYYESNKEELMKKKKIWNEQNKEKVYDSMIKYHYENRHVGKISEWRNKLGIKLREGEDWLSVYLFYVTCKDCENCGIELTDEFPTSATRRNLDHDHKTHYIREVLCQSCNSKRR
jgi:hypothetical protein